MYGHYMVLWPRLTSYDKLYSVFLTPFPHVHKTSPGKNDDFHPIYLLHLPCELRAVLDFGLYGNLIRLTLALYAVSVRQAENLLPASFRFHLTMDTLAFG